MSDTKKSPDYSFSQKHLLGLADYSTEDILYVLEQAKTFREVLDRPVPKIPTLRDKTIVNLFTKTVHEPAYHSSLLKKEWALTS